MSSLIETLSLNNEENNEEEDDDLKLETTPRKEVSKQITNDKKRKIEFDETAPKRRRVDTDSDDEYVMNGTHKNCFQPMPPPTITSNNTTNNTPNTAFSKIMKTPQITKKKKTAKSKSKPTKTIKKSVKKLVEAKFVKLSERKRKLLNQDFDDQEYWNTVAEMAGFNDTEIPILRKYLFAYIKDTKDATDDDRKIVFYPDPPDWLPSKLKKMWNRGSVTFCMINKRIQILNLYRELDICIDPSLYSCIINLKLKIKQTLLKMDESLNRKSIKKKENKLMSINETIGNIKNSDNTTRDMRALCDIYLSMVKTINDKISELDALNMKIKKHLQYELKLVSYSNGSRIHLQYRTLTGSMQYKAPKLLKSYDRILDEIHCFKRKLIEKNEYLLQIKNEYCMGTEGKLC